MNKTCPCGCNTGKVAQIIKENVLSKEEYHNKFCLKKGCACATLYPTKPSLRESVLLILGRFKVIGDTTYGLIYKDAEELVDRIIGCLKSTILECKPEEKGKNKYDDDLWAAHYLGHDEGTNSYHQNLLDKLN